MITPSILIQILFRLLHNFFFIFLSFSASISSQFCFHSGLCYYLYSCFHFSFYLNYCFHFGFRFYSTSYFRSHFLIIFFFGLSIFTPTANLVISYLISYFPSYCHPSYLLFRFLFKSLPFSLPHSHFRTSASVLHSASVALRSRLSREEEKWKKNSRPFGIYF